MILVQARPNTHPGGVHGALIKFRYHSVMGPSFISQLPKPNPPKLINRKINKYLTFDFIIVFYRLDFF